MTTMSGVLVVTASVTATTIAHVSMGKRQVQDEVPDDKPTSLLAPELTNAPYRTRTDAGSVAMESSSEGAASSTLAEAESSGLPTESMMSGAASSIAAAVTEAAIKSYLADVPVVTVTSGNATMTASITACVPPAHTLGQPADEEQFGVGEIALLSSGGRMEAWLPTMMGMAALTAGLVLQF